MLGHCGSGERSGLGMAASRLFLAGRLTSSDYSKQLFSLNAHATEAVLGEFGGTRQVFGMFPCSCFFLCINCGGDCLMNRTYAQDAHPMIFVTNVRTYPPIHCTIALSNTHQHDNDNDNDTLREVPHLSMRAWPYRQERRGHGPTKKNLSYR